MSDFIVRFQGIELSDEHKERLQSAIQKAVLTELTSANLIAPSPVSEGRHMEERFVVLEEYGPGGPPPRHGGVVPGDPGKGKGEPGKGTGETGKGSTSSGWKGDPIIGKPGFPIWKRVPFDSPLTSSPQWKKIWLGIIFMNEKELAGEATLTER